MLTFFLIAVTVLTGILIILGRILPVIAPDAQKNSPYECGFDPIKSTRLPFSFRFFVVAILFLIFDLEIALLIAAPYMAQSLSNTARLKFLIVFLIILIVGLWYEWEKDGLDW